MANNLWRRFYNTKYNIYQFISRIMELQQRMAVQGTLYF